MLHRPAQAGSLESGDALVRVTPTDGTTVVVTIESKVSPRFSLAIERTVREVAAAKGVDAAEIAVIDRGALDFVLRARVATALRRSVEVDANA